MGSFVGGSNRHKLQLSLSVSGESAVACVNGVSGQGIYYSTNAGVGWSAATTGPTDAALLSIAVSGTLGVACVYNTASVGLYYSIDGGDNWLTAATGPTDTTLTSVSISGTRAIACVNGVSGQGIYYSNDGGQNWSSAATGPTNVALSGVSINGLNAVACVNNVTGDGLYYSSDGGIHWTAASTGPTNTNLTSVSISTAYAVATVYNVTGQGIYYSTDLGIHWTLSSASTDVAWSSVSVSGNYVIASIESIVGNEGIYYSSFSSNPICFLPQCSIMLNDGTSKEIKDIKIGEILFPNRKVIAIGSKSFRAGDIEETNLPYMIPKNYFFEDAPSNPVFVSGHHRIIVQLTEKDRLGIQTFKMVEIDNILRQEEVEYYNIVVEDGGYIFSNNLPLETTSMEDLIKNMNIKS